MCDASFWRSPYYHLVATKCFKISIWIYLAIHIYKRAQKCLKCYSSLARTKQHSFFSYLPLRFANKFLKIKKPILNKNTLQIFENVAWKTVCAYIANTTLNEIILKFFNLPDTIRNSVVKVLCSLSKFCSLKVWQSTDFTTVF